MEAACDGASWSVGWILVCGAGSTLEEIASSDWNRIWMVSLVSFNGILYFGNRGVRRCGENSGDLVKIA